MAPKKITDLYQQTKIWQHLESLKNKDAINIVEQSVAYTHGLLERIIETFPTYTLHNGQHQLNILNRIGDLLGSRINELSDLEATLLILSAFYHDLGMVFTDDERQNLQLEEDFPEFLNTFPYAKLAIAKAKEVQKEIAEHYCRWAHAKRVWIYLNQMNDKLNWDGIGLREVIAEVCLSHNESTEYLKEDKFETDYLGKADLLFCSIILRLADILDFDNTRTPDSVYEFLMLDNPKSNRERISYEEWSKHLASRGFSFREWNNSKPYELDFLASPNHPAVENDIRDFLDTIELEFSKCSTILRFCSDKWKTLILPDKIKRANIRSQGYKFGNYRFSLEQKQILNLLMGENLYDNPYVFVRELIQNAIDTSRHREFHEHKQGNKEFTVKSIEVDSWIDNEGYRWIRIDDYGMGMDESIINNYFLKVGNSYYNSDEFMVRKLDYAKADGIDFTPISRFGIGVLSCFIVGDRIELSTKHIDSSNGKTNPIRLSLTGLHGFYVMQTDKDIPNEMPAKTNIEKEYRKDFGTSIAVRLGKNNDDPSFNLKNALEETLLNSPIKVTLKDFGSISNYPDLIEKPLCPDKTFVVKGKILKEMENLLKVKTKSELRLHFINLDIGKYSPNSSIKGQIAVILLENDELKKKTLKMVRSPYSEGGRFYYSLFWSSTSYTDKSFFQFQFELEQFDREDRQFNFTNYLYEISLFKNEIAHKYPHNSIIITHNGIHIPTHNEEDIETSAHISLYSNDLKKSNFLGCEAIGILDLKDEMRPNVSLARNKIVSLSFNLWSTVNYSIQRACQENKFLNASKQRVYLSYNLKPTGCDIFEDIKNDPLLTNHDRWPAIKVIRGQSHDMYSVNEILQSKKRIKISIYNLNSSEDADSFLVGSLIQMYFKVIAILSKVKKGERTTVTVEIQKAKTIDKKDTYLDYFSPFTFVEYENFEGLKPGINNHLPLNINHKYSKWLMLVGEYLWKNYRNYYKIFKSPTDILTINDVIQRFRKLTIPKEYLPPDDLKLFAKDFEYE